MEDGTISAKVQKIIYENKNFQILVISEIDGTFTEENGVDPAAISFRGKTKCTTLTGVFEKPLRAGQCISFTAKSVQYTSKNGSGIQLKLEKLLEYSYDEFNKETIISYLKDKIEGITSSQAMAIVGKFGKDTIKYLGDVDELASIPCISTERAKSIAMQHLQNGEFVKILHAFEIVGVDGATILTTRILEKYGDEAYDIIVSDPYRLYEDGLCDFKVAELIATRRKNRNQIILGYDSMPYVRACILSIFEDLENSGHCCISDWNLFQIVQSRITSSLKSYGKILRNTSLDLRSDEDFAKQETAQKSNVIITALLSLIQDGILVKEKFKTKDAEMNFIYRKEIYDAEKYAAKKILELVHPDESIKVDNADEIIANMENDFGFKYQDIQKEAIVAPLDSHCVIITGGPGTGKTTTIKGVIEFQKRINPNAVIFCAAPTGRASQRMAEATGCDAKTVHRLLEVDPTSGLLAFKHNVQNPLECDVLIIDEFSMVDIILFGALMRAIKPTTKVVFVGDKNQLPSVGPGSVLRDMIVSGRVPSIELQVVFRQDSTSLIAVNANLIKENRVNELQYTGGNFFKFNLKDDDTTLKNTLDLFKNLLNKYQDIYQVQVLVPVKKANYKLGGMALNPILRDIANPKSDRKKEYRSNTKCIFREGDKVMQLKNNYTKDVFNGDLGIIQTIDNIAKEIVVKFQFKKELVSYEFSELKEIELAYAVTIHKSQGSEYKSVIVPMSIEYRNQMFNSKNLLYTGITRAKDVFYFLGDDEAIMFGLTNTETTNRSTTLCQRISGEKFVEDIGGEKLIAEE